MYIDYLIEKEGDLSTYHKDKIKLIRDPAVRKRLIRVEDAIEHSKEYKELVNRFEIKMLDSQTRLAEIKIDRLRVLHVLIKGETIVLLGVFMKKTQKTPRGIMAENNQRIAKYEEKAHEQQNH